MSNTLPNDGLLKAARIITMIFMVILGILFVGLAVAVPGFLLSSSHVAKVMVADASASLGGLLAGIVALLLIAMVMVALGITFLRLLRLIIDSVGNGDPFIADNAERLRKMGWIAIIIEVLKMPIGALGIFIATQVEGDSIKFDVEFSLTGFLLALVLFILARVFRKGTEMREDLEGTV